MSGIFVTAIGTDAGKTHVSCALIRAMAAQGRNLTPVKPLMTGLNPEQLAESDAGRLIAAQGRAVTDDAVADVALRWWPDYTAPNIAARLAGHRVSMADVLAFTRPRIAAAEHVLVEGAGGVMSPLTDDATNIDLIVALGLPVLLVACNYLGAVSHTLTALECLERRGVQIAAVVVSQPWPTAGPPDGFADELRRLVAPPVVLAPFAKAGDPEPFAAELATRLFG